MSFKDILAPILEVKADEAALAAAESMAEAADAQVTALLLQFEPDPVYSPDGVMVSAVWADILKQAQERAAAEKARLDKRAQTGSRALTSHELKTRLGFAAGQIGVAARYADLVVMLRPGGGAQADVRINLFEGALFGAGRPVLLAPPAWRKGPIGRNIVIAWNGKREAARAVGDAISLLEHAETVTVVTVGAEAKVREEAEASAGELAAHLDRRGIRAGVRVIGDLGFSEANTLLAEAKAAHADLIVMGGYGRSRFGEFIFGGVTRELLDTADIPLFMSH